MKWNSFTDMVNRAVKRSEDITSVEFFNPVTNFYSRVTDRVFFCTDLQIERNKSDLGRKYRTLGYISLK